jgi:hypothetical protein
MATAESRKIAIDEVVEAAALGVLRALEARASAGAHGASTQELVKSGFFVDFVIRAGGYPGPIEILGAGNMAKGR